MDPVRAFDHTSGAFTASYVAHLLRETHETQARLMIVAAEIMVRQETHNVRYRNPVRAFARTLVTHAAI